jgi:hypothetical protein
MPDSQSGPMGPVFMPVRQSLAARHVSRLEPTSSVRQAMMRLGLRQVCEIAKGTSLRRAMPVRIFSQA